MNGLGIVKGLWITFKHFIGTYVQNFRLGRKEYFNQEAIERRRRADSSGIFTVQYPEEKLPVPEEFRYIPFLVYELGENGEKNIRCTACGICSKVCPPQCIWIERAVDAQTGKPVSSPKEFFIDIDICMNCGFCAEFCPFDAIKMDHDYEIAGVDRMAHHIFNKERLMKPASYYQKIRPANFAREEEARAQKAARKTGAEG